MLWIGIPLGIYLLLCGLVFLLQDILTFPGAGRLSGSMEAAITLYESLGFVRWGSNPQYARVGGRSIAGHFYLKELADSTLPLSSAESAVSGESGESVGSGDKVPS